MRKTKNGYTIYLSEWHNTIYVSKNGVTLGQQTFSDAIKARIAFNNL